MKMATVLSGNAVQAVISTCDTTHEMTQWSAQVCAPAMDLAATTMPALSIGWGRSVVVYSGCAVLGVIGSFSVGLSPVALSALDTTWFPLALRVGCGFSVLVCTAFPLLV